MSERMKNPALSVPGAMQALLDLSKAAQQGISTELRDLVNLRASQINGCSVCVYSHARDLKKAGESDERIFSVAAWRDTPYFTEGERAVLALTEAVTRLSDQANAVPDEIWNEAARHYDQAALSSLVLSIGVINIWNRLNVTTKQLAGAAW
jgi:AhpD family alkylhydroperoxidase